MVIHYIKIKIYFSSLSPCFFFSLSLHFIEFPSFEVLIKSRGPGEFSLLITLSVSLSVFMVFMTSGTLRGS